MGAPRGGDDGNGAIFIFHGSKDFRFGKDFLSKCPCSNIHITQLSLDQYQKIQAQELKVQMRSGLSGFGYSISKETSNIHSNGLGIFAVGAPFGESDSPGSTESAVVLRSRKVTSFTDAIMFYGEPVIDLTVRGKNKTFL